MRAAHLVALVIGISCGVPAIAFTSGHAAMPLGSPGNWVSPDDYPAEAIKNGDEGITSFRLRIDGAGKVADCVITGSSGSQSLDDATCEIVSVRAQFAPAADAAGMPREDSFSSRVRWTLPEEPFLVPPSATATLEYDLLPTGRLASCLFDGWTGSDLASFCDHAPAFKFTPVAGKDGKPLTKHIVVHQTIAVTDKPSN